MGCSARHNQPQQCGLCAPHDGHTVTRAADVCKRAKHMCTHTRAHGRSRYAPSHTLFRTLCFLSFFLVPRHQPVTMPRTLLISAAHVASHTHSVSKHLNVRCVSHQHTQSGHRFRRIDVPPVGSWSAGLRATQPCGPAPGTWCPGPTAQRRPSLETHSPLFPWSSWRPRAVSGPAWLRLEGRAGPGLLLCPGLPLPPERVCSRGPGQAWPAASGHLSASPQSAHQLHHNRYGSCWDATTRHVIL